MKKLFYFLLMLSVCLCLFSVLALASEPTASEESVSTDDALADTTEDADTPSENAEKTDGTFLNTLYSAYEENKSELFSLASAVVSLVLVFVYQKGLFPTVKGGLTLIEGQVKALREVSRDSNEQTQRAADESRALALEMAQSAKTMQVVLESIAARAEGEQTKKETLKRLEDCLLWQAELLGEVFLHSSLPEYQKERVSHVLERVKTTLAHTESEA